MNTVNEVSFVLDNSLVTIHFDERLGPTTTLLQYLRGLSNHKDVKEGCAEGDCGACTVALGTLTSEDNITYQACDSCLIFLPQLNGKWVLTANSIGTSRALHSVQKAMVDWDGSQCGYCTPGFVMSIFALQKNHANPSRAVVDDALTGNLCRCTGYRSIVDSARAACNSSAIAQNPTEENTPITLLKSIAQNSVAIQTKGQVYKRPKSLEEALRYKEEHPEALIVNGATDVGLLVTKKRENLPSILDIAAVRELKEISESQSDITYKAGASLQEVLVHSESHFPALSNMLKVFGSLQIRNLATLGGNIASASPIGDTAPVLMAYNATVNVRSQSGSRAISMQDFITGYRSTALLANELIISISIPKDTSATVISYKISKRKDLDISTVSFCGRLTLDSDSTVSELALYYGGMAAMTKRASKTEKALVGKKWTRQVVEDALVLLAEDFTPICDARSGALAREVMAQNLLLKFWLETTSTEK